MQKSNSPTVPTSAILGATSALGQAVARRLAKEGHHLALCARDSNKLSVVEDDLKVRATSSEVDGDLPAKVWSLAADFADIDSHDSLVDAIADVDNIWFFFGSLPDQAVCESNWESTYEAMHTNFICVCSLLSRLATVFEKRGYGSLIVVSSVAGDRGRKSNYVYGASKGALSLYCQGLRNRLATSNVQVLDVKPGFIDTPMTAHLEKTPSLLWASADRVADDMISAHKKRRDIVYSPWFWRYILLIIKCIPERIFKRLSL